MNPPDPDRLLAAATKWGEARRRLRRARAHRATFACEFHEVPAGPEDGPGVPKCYQSGHDLCDWCDTCSARRAADDLFRVARRRLSNATHVLDRLFP